MLKLNNLHILGLLLVLNFIIPINSQKGQFSPLEWMIGTWVSESGGKLMWPSVPTMTYGERMVIAPAETSKRSTFPMLKITSETWHHLNKDHFLDSTGFFRIEGNGNVTLLSVGNNGFSTVERSAYIGINYFRTELTNVVRSHTARNIPVERIDREFRLIDRVYMEQIVHMKTEHQPVGGTLEHARVLYKKM